MADKKTPKTKAKSKVTRRPVGETRTTLTKGVKARKKATTSAHSPTDSVAKKPFYKEWWFWVIVILILLVVAGCSSNNTKTTPSPSTPSSTTKETEEPTIEVANFSTMAKDEIRAWGEKSSVKITFTTSYSDTVAKDGFIEQAPTPGAKIKKNDTVKIVYSLGKAPTTGERNALQQAESYLRHLSFSRSGLIHQLEYEGYSTEEATYAVDNVTVDWNEQAAKTAKSYLSHQAFSRDGLIHQLEYEGFTREQAEYGVSQNGY